MLTESDRRVACEFRRRLLVVTPIVDMRVCGSRARGDATPDSDPDIFVEVETLTAELRRRISELAWEVGFDADRVISTVVTTREQLERGAMRANPLIRMIEREGIRP